MDLKLILEAILFSAQQPMSPKDLKGVLAGAIEHSEDPEVKKLKRTSLDTITKTLEDLRADHDQTQRSFHLACVAGSWQFVSKTEFAPWIKTLVGHRSRPPRLSQPALETLAIIAYRQPLTRSDIEQIRGVAVDGVMHTLTERGLVVQVGRAEVPGRPITYGTSPLFLEYFGLGSLDDLPVADELRRIPIEKPEGLLTVDPGLQTTPEDQENEQPVNPETTPDSDPQASATPTDASSQTDTLPVDQDDEDADEDEDDEEEYDDEDDDDDEEEEEDEADDDVQSSAPVETSKRGRTKPAKPIAD